MTVASSIETFVGGWGEPIEIFFPSRKLFVAMKDTNAAASSSSRAQTRERERRSFEDEF